MLTVGLTGGYATGKSFVAGALERLGCFVIYADRLGHAALAQDGEAYTSTVEAFGPDILEPDGSINRKKLGAIAFASPERLSQLNSFVHPAVFRLEEQMLREYAAEHRGGLAVVEAAILIETGRYKTFDRIIVTACDEEMQVERGSKRDHLTRGEVLRRLALQLPLSEKRNYADYVIDTSGSKESTLGQVDAVFLKLKQAAEAAPA